MPTCDFEMEKNTSKSIVTFNVKNNSCKSTGSLEVNKENSGIVTEMLKLGKEYFDSLVDDIEIDKNFCTTTGSLEVDKNSCASTGSLEVDKDSCTSTGSIYVDKNFFTSTGNLEVDNCMSTGSLEMDRNSCTSTGSLKVDNPCTTGSLEVDNPCMSTGSLEVDNPCTSTGSLEVDNPCTSTGSLEVDNPCTSTGTLKVDKNSCTLTGSLEVDKNSCTSTRSSDMDVENCDLTEMLKLGKEYFDSLVEGVEIDKNSCTSMDSLKVDNIYCTSTGSSEVDNENSSVLSDMELDNDCFDSLVNDMDALFVKDIFSIVFERRTLERRFRHIFYKQSFPHTQSPFTPDLADSCRVMMHSKEIEMFILFARQTKLSSLTANIIETISNDCIRSFVSRDFCPKAFLWMCLTICNNAALAFNRGISVAPYIVINHLTVLLHGLRLRGDFTDDSWRTIEAAGEEIKTKLLTTDLMGPRI